jgi:hypothetical protein
MVVPPNNSFAKKIERVRHTTAGTLPLERRGNFFLQALGGISQKAIAPPDPVPVGKSQTARKETPKRAVQTCQLIPSDVARHLERAGAGSRGGLYRCGAPIQRCYREPNNERANNGLAKTVKAQQTDGKLSH